MSREITWNILMFLLYLLHSSILKCLLKKSCRFLSHDENRNTALHLACQNGHYEATELLLQFQIGYNERSVFGVNGPKILLSQQMTMPSPSPNLNT